MSVLYLCPLYNEKIKNEEKETFNLNSDGKHPFGYSCSLVVSSLSQLPKDMKMDKKNLRIFFMWIFFHHKVFFFTMVISFCDRKSWDETGDSWWNVVILLMWTCFTEFVPQKKMYACTQYLNNFNWTFPFSPVHNS